MRSTNVSLSSLLFVCLFEGERQSRRERGREGERLRGCVCFHLLHNGVEAECAASPATLQAALQWE